MTRTSPDTERIRSEKVKLLDRDIMYRMQRVRLLQDEWVAVERNLDASRVILAKLIEEREALFAEPEA